MPPKVARHLGEDEDIIDSESETESESEDSDDTVRGAVTFRQLTLATEISSPRACSIDTFICFLLVGFN